MKLAEKLCSMFKAAEENSSAGSLGTGPTASNTKSKVELEKEDELKKASQEK